MKYSVLFCYLIFLGMPTIKKTLMFIFSVRLKVVFHTHVKQ